MMRCRRSLALFPSHLEPDRGTMQRIDGWRVLRARRGGVASHRGAGRAEGAPDSFGDVHVPFVPKNGRWGARVTLLSTVICVLRVPHSGRGPQSCCETAECSVLSENLVTDNVVRKKK